MSKRIGEAAGGVRKIESLTEISLLLRDFRDTWIHAEDCKACESDTGFVDKIEKSIRLEGDLSAEQRSRLLCIADRCPVHKTLHNEILIESNLVD